jgi:transcriptional regulator with XRE-family HTH domain
MSQVELARAVGISESHVSRILKGQGDLPAPALLDPFARALRMEPAVLHRAYAVSVGLRFDVETIEDGGLSEVVAIWPDMSEADREALLAAAVAFAERHKRLGGDN